MIKIKKHIISNTEKAYIIAEIGLSHNGILKNAIKMIDASSKAGADAVKFQMHFAEYESSVHEKFRSGYKFKDKSRYDYWKRTAFTYSQWDLIRKHCLKKKIDFICSPFSTKAVEVLDNLNVDAWKIASGEFNNYILLNSILLKNKKPIILSTGLTYDKEIKAIIKYVKKRNKNIILLQCTSKYPTKINEAGHNLISEFKNKYNVISGISDHTGNINSAFSSVCLGAKIIELHVCFSKKEKGPDVQSSITFDDLKKLIEFRNDFHLITKSNISKAKLDNNQTTLRKVFGKSLVAKNLLKKNSLIKLHDLTDLKPLKGLSVFKLQYVLNKKLSRDIKPGTFIQKKFLKI